jgi:nucleoside-diphosphate-sugar epimerase
MSPKKVLVTGAAGVIGNAVRHHLSDRYDIRSLTRQPASFPSLVGDITQLETILPAFDGVDAVVHLAAASGVEDGWDDVLQNNVVGTYNVFEAARQAGVDLVVYASSHHAVGMYEIDGIPSIHALDDPRVIDHRVEPRPDSLYGVTKVFGEALGHYYVDQHGMRCHCLRIGSVRADDDPRSEAAGVSLPWLGLSPEQVYDRLRATWLSQRDCAELIACCLEADHIRFGVYYGTSDNPRQLWDLAHARSELGYQPRDSAPVG